MTRRKDAAYYLLGIFGVNMPLIYGEGDQAFIRLQEEIMKRSDDHTIFAWKAAIQLERESSRGPLAASASEFIDSKTIQRSTVMRSSLYIMTNRGLQMKLPLLQLDDNDHIAILNCKDTSKLDNTVVGIYLTQLTSRKGYFGNMGESNYARTEALKLVQITRASLKKINIHGIRSTLGANPTISGHFGLPAESISS